MPTETGYNGAFTGPQIDAALAKAQKAITEQELNEALGKLGGGYIHTFNDTDWISSPDGGLKIDIPSTVHKMQGDFVECKVVTMPNFGVTWATIGTSASIDSNGTITLYYPGSSGYSGRAILKVHNV